MAPSVIRTGVVRQRWRLVVTAATSMLAVLAVAAGPPVAAGAAGGPYDVRAQAGNNTARVTWVPAPGADPQLTYYQVRSAPGGQTSYVEGTETGATVRFLDNGTAYSFTVTAYGDEPAASSEPSPRVTPRDICTIRGTAGDDVLVGTPGDDALCGLGGDDTLRGGGGGDTYVGGVGTDVVDFRAAADRVFAFLPDVAHMVTAHGLGWADGDGTDVLRPDVESMRGSEHADVLEGDDGTNRIVGGRGADLVRGWDGADVVVGSAGRDELWGLSGQDRLLGRGGADLLLPRGDDDVVDGGRGTDTVGFTSAVTVDLAAGTASGENADVLRLVENVVGSPEADVLRGSAADNVLRGGGGADDVSGLAGADTLYGHDGDDTLDGGAGGGDRCDGGAGVDTAARCESVVKVP